MGRKKPTGTRVLVALVVIVILAFVLGLLNRSLAEWVCQNGAWVAIGRPKGYPPNSDCRLPLPTPSPVSKPVGPEGTSSAGTPLGGFFFEGTYLSEESALLPDGYEASQEAKE
ncbi:hypothetical protein MUP65_01550 [Patescibacteria group bacterium]|nr:hypothetical protein [Patescibacteria group bacterium]